MPSVLLLTILLFYNFSTPICYEPESTFLLDNTYRPSLKNLPGNETIIEEFESFLFSKYREYKPGNNITAYKLQELSKPSKHYLLKSIGFKREASNNQVLVSIDIGNRIISSFTSFHFTENMLSLLREFGFLNFCSVPNFIFDPLIFDWDTVSNYDVFFQFKANTVDFGVVDFWWRGYSPYDKDFSDDFDTLLDALLIFDGENRFSEHIVCLSKIFDINPNVLNRDFRNMRDLKVAKTSMVVRKGEFHNGTFTLDFHESNSSFAEGEKFTVKLFPEYINKLWSTSGNHKDFSCQRTLSEEWQIREEIQARTLTDIYEWKDILWNLNGLGDIRTRVVNQEAGRDTSGLHRRDEGNFCQFFFCLKL